MLQNNKLMSRIRGCREPHHATGYQRSHYTTRRPGVNGEGADSLTRPPLCVHLQHVTDAHVPIEVDVGGAGGGDDRGGAGALDRTLVRHEDRPGVVNCAVAPEPVHSIGIVAIKRISPGVKRLMKEERRLRSA